MTLVEILIAAIVAIIILWRFALSIGGGFNSERSEMPALDAPYNGMNIAIPFMILILVALLAWQFLEVL